MTLKNSQDRYSTLIIGLHWLMLVLLVAVYAAMELRDLAPKGSALRADLKILHFLLGLCVLGLVVVRLGGRWVGGDTPPVRPPMPGWQDRFARLMHYALYAFMIVTPLLGWLTLSAAGKPINLFGVVVPALIGADESLSHQLKDFHEALATAGYFLIGLHAAAALVHHYVTRDNTLVRMLPGRRL
ncbi:cytochrome b [Imbroritus primus]|uniref:Cytochrome b n=1 Tax=Imbroritus primus TaxID=3058603 RepID=A0ACD3SMU0_9BURK|nr:cytochrome b [Burkholderiaceae bacterium PBA]